MKKVWEQLRKRWKGYWEDDEFNENKQHLSQHDKRSLLYGGFILSAFTLSLCLLSMGINYVYISSQNNKEMEKTIEIICTYLATATEDEYADIAQSIRHDLVISEYGQDIEDIIQYIPNSADGCCLEEGSTECINLVFVNTGEIYGLEIFNRSDPLEQQREDNRIIVNSGYDEISETHIMVIKKPNTDSGTASIDRGRKIVSVHKMKTHFCDACIRKILNATQNEFIGEAVIYDAEENVFYPIKEGELQIGEYSLQTIYEDSGYRIEIEYIGS